VIRVERLTELLRHRHAVVLGARHGHGGGIETEMMDMGGGHTMAILPAWSSTHALPISVMWWVMMVAMMLLAA